MLSLLVGIEPDCEGETEVLPHHGDKKCFRLKASSGKLS